MMKHIKILGILAASMFAASLPAAAGVELITNVKQLSTNARSNNPNFGNLLDDNKYTVFITDENYSSEKHYLQVDFPEGLSLANDENLVVCLRRAADNALNAAAPTAMEIHHSTDGVNFDNTPFARVYFIYRGVGTVEFSTPINCDILKSGVKALRFTVTMNNTKKIIAGDVRAFGTAGFQLYKVRNGENIKGLWRDRFHLTTDYNYLYLNHNFKNTPGVLDPINQHTYAEGGYLRELGGFDKFVDGKWTLDLDFLARHKIDMPDYTMLTSANDTGIKNPNLQLQPTHVVEHELYAIQGDVIALYPFYSFSSIGSYQENFSHWYNYKTGGHVTNKDGYKLLDFLIDPSSIAVSENYGYYGGTALDADKREITINSEEEFIAFAKTITNNCHVSLSRDLDFERFGPNPFPPLGSTGQPWRATFNGNGHTIKNLKFDNTNTGVGLFGWISGGAIIQNIIIDSSCSFKGKECVGAIGGFRGSGNAIIRGVINNGELSANLHSAGIIGSVTAPDGGVNITVEDCAFGGRIVGGDYNAYICSWVENGHTDGAWKVNFNIKNTYTNGTSNWLQDGHEFFRHYEATNQPIVTVQNSYSDVYTSQGFIKIPEGISTSEFANRLGGNWKVENGALAVSTWPIDTSTDTYKPTRYYGTVGTFFYPRDPFAHEGNLRSLPEEYVIAADFAQDFWNNPQGNLPSDSKTIIEPTIQFRHIFRIKDGKKFADDNMSTVENNRAFIRKNLRHITATANTFFQVRLDSPIPAEKTTPSKWYYKIDDTDYRRINSMHIRVYKDNVLIQDGTDKNVIFYPSESFAGDGSRTIENEKYYLCGGGGHYYRMLACSAANAQPGRYTVQLVAKDYNDKIIKIPGTDTDLLVQELQITFLPEQASLMFMAKEEKEIKSRYPHATNEYLQSRYGEPSDKLDFDNYRLLENKDSVYNPDWYIRTLGNDENKRYFRWPVKWENANYGFGYNMRHDYNMYNVANNSMAVVYHAATNNLGRDYNYQKGVGLFDRLFYDTEGAQRGYFYYVNASADPGIMARLRLDTFCPGSTIHVTGWVSEFSGSETANLSINFVARMKNGERIPLHSHITGYVPSDKLGRWMYIYSSFVPILTDKDFDFSQLSHYEIELDNNCKNSGGADYAIDDIRVYTVRPIIYADQMAPVCMKQEHTDVRISADFDVLMQSLGIEETLDIESDTQQGEEIDLFYSFLDKKKYDEALAAGKSTDDAFDEAILRYNYGGEEETTFGHLTFRSCWADNEQYNDDGISNTKVRHAYKWLNPNTNSRMIVFNTQPTDATMQTGKEYIVALYTQTKDASQGGYITEPGANDYAIESECAKKCILTVQASHVIKIDGEVRNQQDEIDACRNQSPVVQVDLWGQKLDENGKPIEGEFDLIEENAVFDWFEGSMEEFVEIKEGSTTLWDALSHFRELYPTATDLSDEPRGEYTEEDRKLIAKYSDLDPEGKVRPLLTLARSSFIFQPLLLPDGQTQADAYVLAVPIPVKKETIVICTQPTEVHVVVRQRAPRLAHGIPSIEYPAAISDVPLRISLSRLESASAPMSTASRHNAPLVLPIRLVHPVSEGVESMRIPGGGSPIFLAGTNDPLYKNLAGNGKEDGTLWTIGEVKELVAHRGKIDEDKVSLVFYNDRMTFREGYEYRMRFIFEEAASAEADLSDICSGHVVFTLKVVPEYQKWTGTTNLNWNNDNNWRRVTSSEILFGSPSDRTSDGPNDRTFSYAPLDFTKTVIPAGDNVPELFEATKETQQLAGKSYDWTPQPSEHEMSGPATILVQYDMVQRVESSTPGTFCRPWQAHFCEQIHFESGAEIGNQQHLNYERAWVDMEVNPSRWYTLSSPLQASFAGDMYLPTAGARQNTSYFKDINFEYGADGPYNRFKPAVFQRSWNQASAKVYNYNDNPEDVTDVKVLTTWSNVYNDVNVPYSAGHGFSIKADLTNMTGEQPDKVLFRLPKADMTYLYYTESGASGDATNISRNNAYRLNPSSGEMKIEAATSDNKYFLVGNPFMAHLDIARFLNDNQGVIKSKYWILDADRQGAAVMDGNGDLVGTLDDPEYVAPMQGFFVEAINPGTSLTLKYNESMMATVNNKSDLSGVITRSGNGLPGLRITARESGSAAMVRLDGASSTAYEANEDAMFIADATLESSALVYTIAEGTATTVNVLPEISATEIGLIAEDDTETTLLFEGVDNTSDLMVYDALDDSYSPLHEGMEITVRGAAQGRLFIVSDRMGSIESGLQILVMGNIVKVVSPNGNLSAKVFDTVGRLIDGYNDGGSEASFTLQRGIYIVEAIDENSRETKKVLIKR